jgi:DNA-binding HxlR family transcriptional regulator
MCAKKIDAAERQSERERVEALLCPVRYFLNVFGGKWKLPIVCMLTGEEPIRYSSIKRKLGGITSVMLAQSLKELEVEGVVHREQYNEVPPRVEYTLTEEGRSILPTLLQAAAWAEKNMKQKTACNPYCDRCHATN